MKPDWKSLVRSRIGSLPVDPAREVDIVDELALHVGQHFDELTRSGMPNDAAMEQVLAPLSDPKRIAREIARADRPRATAPVPPAADRAGVLAGLTRDVRYAVRVLRRAPAFAAAAIITLGLGIGANTTIFSVVHAVLLRPLPFQSPDRLVMIGERGENGRAGNVGFATFVDWRQRSHSFDDMALIRSWSTTLATNGEPERIAALRVSANYFGMLGVRPALGRDFRTADDTPSAWHVVILSDRLWRRRFSADPGVIGRSLQMNDVQYQVIGVLPASFQPLISEHFYQRADIWAPVGYDVSLPSACRSCQHLKAIGRVTAGTSFAVAAQDVNEIHAALRRTFPADYSKASTITATPLAEELSDNIRPALTALTGAVAFVLLIACANVANLLLARIAHRQRDLALRTAIGASRAHIVRQLLVESAIIAVAGGALGVALSAVAVPLIVHLTPVAISRLADARVDLVVIAYGLAVSLATTVLFGLLPALRAARIDLAASLHGDGRRTASASASAARRVLVATDVALAVVLLAGAGLMIRSVGRLVGVNPGFDPERVLTMQVTMVGTRYAKDEAVVAMGDAILAKVRAMPGVQAAALAGQIPLGGNGDTWGFHVVGRPPSPDDPSVERYSVTPDYFAVMRIPLVRGRLITDADRAGAERVMLVGEQTARTVWPHEDPIGQHVRIGGFDGPPYTVVGIVGDVRHQELAAPPTQQMYMSQMQLTDSFLTVVIRTTIDPASIAGEARRAIWAAAADVPIYAVAPLRELVAKSVGPRRFVMVLLELFGATALLMTAVGVYGVIAYSVAERTREIGLRAALGATPSSIARLVIGSGLAVVVAGLVAGCAIAIAATRYLQASLFGVSAMDPLTFSTVVLVLLAVTLVAQGVPVARAVRVDPSVALRQE